MSYTFKLRMSGKFFQLAFNVRRHQVNPTDNSGDEWILVGQTQQPSRLLNTVAGLNKHCIGNCVVGEHRFKLRRQIAAIEYTEVTAHPRISKTTHLPEVLM